jgi:hypothetical protein
MLPDIFTKPWKDTFKLQKVSKSVICVFYRLWGKGIKVLAYLARFKLQNMNVVRRFRRILNKSPNKVMLVNGTTDEEWTFQQVKL